MLSAVQVGLPSVGVGGRPPRGGDNLGMPVKPVSAQTDLQGRKDEAVQEERKGHAVRGMRTPVRIQTATQPAPLLLMHWLRHACVTGCVPMHAEIPRTSKHRQETPLDNPNVKVHTREHAQGLVVRRLLAPRMRKSQAYFDTPHAGCGMVGMQSSVQGQA